MKALNPIVMSFFGWLVTSQATPTSKRAAQNIRQVAVTSSYKVQAYPNQVVDNNDTLTGGLEGAYAEFTLDLDSGNNSLCYNITVVGFRGEYQSPAFTATHLHEAGVGYAGPPRIAFPNPEGSGEGPRSSIGCLAGPFETGILNDGVDTGRDFEIGEIEHYPGGFFVDIHSSLAVPGAVRGQLS